MTTLRSRLRLWATAWLVFQAASLAALAPGACCIDRPARAERDRHASAGAAHCPMPAADGSACPMHRAQSTGPAAKTTTDARLTGCACEESALFTLIATPGILTDPPAPLFRGAGHRRAADPAGAPLGRFRSPDPRPPRA